MRTLVAASLFVVGLTAATAAAQALPERRLDLTFHEDGTVSLAAQNVSARDILQAWQQQCGCEVINAAQLPGGAIMVPLQFERAAQRTVLQSLLRQAAGYVLTPKPADRRTVSDYGAIYILATSHAVEGAYVPSPQTSMSPLPTAGSPDDEIPPVLPIVPAARDSFEPPVASTPAPQTDQTPGRSPFGSRTDNPFARTPAAVPAPATGAPTAAPGAVTPPPPSMPTPGQAPVVTPQTYGVPPPPLPSGGTIVPIVPAQPGE